jgi:hypothetical protein
MFPTSRIPGISHPASLIPGSPGIPEGDMDMDMATTLIAWYLLPV